MPEVRSDPRLERFCRKSGASYEIDKTGGYYVKVAATNGAPHAVLLGSIREDFTLLETFIIKGRVKDPELLAEAIYKHTGKVFVAYSSPDLDTIYLSTRIEPALLKIESIEQFADICENFEALLEHIGQNGSWSGNLLTFVFIPVKGNA